MLKFGFNCLPVLWQSNVAMEQSLLSLVLWLVLLLKALQGLKRNCSEKVICADAPHGA